MLRTPAAKAVILDAEGLRRAWRRIAHEVIERQPNLAQLSLLGIVTRGLPLAQRLAVTLEELEGVRLSVIPLDVRASRGAGRSRSPGATDPPGLHWQERSDVAAGVGRRPSQRNRWRGFGSHCRARGLVMRLHYVRVLGPTGLSVSQTVDVYAEGAEARDATGL